MTYVSDEQGIFRPDIPVSHRNDEYKETGFQTLLDMQQKHFWYVGRHKFLLASLLQTAPASGLKAIDLGGGVGGWVRYLLDHQPDKFDELALGDSSEVALLGAKTVLPGSVNLYQTDLMNLQWKNRWDVIFLLDVIEHCPDDRAILQQVYEALKPGGKLIVSTPALQCFWSYNDEYSQHLRRYSVADYQRLADQTRFRLADARYFMFFLSPLYWLSRKSKPKNLSDEALAAAIQKEHRVPGRLVNGALTRIFCAESPVGNHVRFPWGTSVLGVFEK